MLSVDKNYVIDIRDEKERDLVIAEYKEHEGVLKGIEEAVLNYGKREIAVIGDKQKELGGRLKEELIRYAVTEFNKKVIEKYKGEEKRYIYSDEDIKVFITKYIGIVDEGFLSKVSNGSKKTIGGYLKYKLRYIYLGGSKKSKYEQDYKKVTGLMDKMVYKYGNQFYEGLKGGYIDKGIKEDIMTNLGIELLKSYTEKVVKIRHEVLEEEHKYIYEKLVKKCLRYAKWHKDESKLEDLEGRVKYLYRGIEFEITWEEYLKETDQIIGYAVIEYIKGRGAWVGNENYIEVISNNYAKGRDVNLTTEEYIMLLSDETVYNLFIESLINIAIMDTIGYNR